jgi:hypothetical protein
MTNLPAFTPESLPKLREMMAPAMGPNEEDQGRIDQCDIEDVKMDPNEYGIKCNNNELRIRIVTPKDC